MKFVNKSEEPKELREYRQNNPNSSWQNFRDECQSGLDKVYETLSKDQGGLCAYCEIKVTKDNRQVEHFHEKSDSSDPNNPTRWHLDWNNLWYCCKGGAQKSDKPDTYLKPVKENLSCGSHKNDGDYRNMLSPNEIPMFPRIFYYERLPDRVLIHADESLCLQAGIDNNRVKNTIDALNLNCKRLREARLAVIKPIMSTISEMQPTRDQTKKLATHLLGDKHENGEWGEFFTMIRWQLGKVAEEYLREIQQV